MPLHCPKENPKEKENKINIKSEKLNKRKKKLSVFKVFHNTIQVLFNQLYFCMVHQFYLLRRKMVFYVSMLTSVVLTISSKRIVIHFHSSPHSILVLFVKKKDGLLYLCVDFCSLNCIFKKDHYSLLLISNLLDLLCKAQVYSKINLYHAYYFVCIANSDK